MSKFKKRKNTNSRSENCIETRSRRIQKKPYHKVEFQEKLQIIAAVEKGQTKVDIGKEFGIHPRTVTCIYRQKDDVLKQCRHNFTIGLGGNIDMNQCLLNWFIGRINTNFVVDGDIKAKAEEIAHSIGKRDFKFTKQWFTTFRLCNNIVKHKGQIEGTPDKGDCVEWSKIIEDLNEDDVYVGGTCSLLYTDNLQNFISNNLSFENFVSLLLLTNITGSDKHKLIVVGSDISQTGMQSLPLEYFHKENAKIDNFIVSNFLTNWDKELIQKNKKVLLAFQVPDCYVDRLQLQQIKILNCSNIKFISKTFTKIINCFKYHYRKLQIMQTFSFRKNEVDFMEYIRMLSLSWHNVSMGTIYNIFHPRYSGCYYFNNLQKHNLENEENDKFSLSEWCTTHGIPLKLEDGVLDHFIACDNSICSLDCLLDKPNYVNLNEWLAQGDTCTSTSAIDTFQAAKRLLRYIQSESGSLEILNSAKFLEDQFEVEACMEVQQNIDMDGTNEMES